MRKPHAYLSARYNIVDPLAVFLVAQDEAVFAHAVSNPLVTMGARRADHPGAVVARRLGQLENIAVCSRLAVILNSHERLLAAGRSTAVGDLQARAFRPAAVVGHRKVVQARRIAESSVQRDLAIPLVRFVAGRAEDLCEKRKPGRQRGLVDLEVQRAEGALLAYATRRRREGLGFLHARGTCGRQGPSEAATEAHLNWVAAVRAVAAVEAARSIVASGVAMVIALHRVATRGRAPTSPGLAIAVIVVASWCHALHVTLAVAEPLLTAPALLGRLRRTCTAEGSGGVSVQVK